MQHEATLGDYWSALYAHKWIILVVTLSSMGFSLWLSHYLPPVYEAKASFFVPANLQAPSFTGGSPQRLTQTILKPVPDEKEAGLVIGVLKGQDLGAQVRKQFPQREPSFFGKNVDFSASPQFFIDIFVRDRDPQLAADVANAYVAAYRDFHTDKLRVNARQAADVLSAQYASLSERLAQKSAAIRQYQLKSQLVSEGETEQRYAAQVRDVERQLDEATIEVQTARARLGSRTRPPAIDGETATRDEAISSPAMEALNRLEVRQAALTQKLDALREGSRGAISKLSDLHSLNGERRLLQEMLSTVELNLTEARVQSESAQAQIVTVQTAQPSKQPGFPIAGLNGAVGLILGFVAGCYNALLLEYLRQRRLERARRQIDDSLLVEVSP
jgi:uncharacterized protein involved in exopolysaccharide biosynthesis